VSSVDVSSMSSAWPSAKVDGASVAVGAGLGRAAVGASVGGGCVGASVGGAAVGAPVGST
jgi:hypothetical protein